MITEEYVSSAALTQTSCSTAYPDLVLRCVVLATIPLRTCEFSNEKVFSVLGSLSPASPISSSSSTCETDASQVRVNFYGAWGMAAAFTDPGDVIILQGFYRLAVPPHSRAGAAAGAENEEGFATTVVCPLSGEDSALRVLQPGKSGDVMEVLVSPQNFEAICMRGLSASDGPNHVFVRQCVALRTAQQQE